MDLHTGALRVMAPHRVMAPPQDMAALLQDTEPTMAPPVTQQGMVQVEPHMHLMAPPVQVDTAPPVPDQPVMAPHLTLVVMAPRLLRVVMAPLPARTAPAPP